MIMQAMSEREETYVLQGKVQLDDAYLGGESNGGRAGRRSEHRVPFVAAASLDETGHPIHMKVSKVATFSFAAIADWPQDALARGCEVISVISDGLACFRAVSEVGSIHQPVIAAGRHPKDLPDLADRKIS